MIRLRTGIILLSLLLVLTACQQTRVVERMNFTTASHTAASESLISNTTTIQDVTATNDVRLSDRGGVNISIGKLSATTLTPVPNQTVVLTFEVTNRGANLTIPYTLIAHSNNKNIINRTSNITLKEGTLYRIIIENFTLPQGVINLTVELDPDNTLKDFDLYDNKKSLVFVVREHTSLPKSAFLDNGCADSDNGKDYIIKGECKDSGAYQQGMSDYCISENEEAELYCSESSNSCAEETHICKCVEGVCI